MKLTLAAVTSLAVFAATPEAQQPMSVQLGVRLSPDTVTVGEHFTAVIRVRAPLGATIQFPQAGDSAASPTSTGIVGKPEIRPIADSAATMMSAAYRLAAWDIGPQPLGVGDIVVIAGADTSYVSLADRSVFVRSVLPGDSALRVPKPPRPAIELLPFNWLPFLIAALALAAAVAAWRLWIWYRRRRNAPMDPFSAAEREFARIEALGLVGKGEPERHAALMSDVVREYLARRVPRIERSHTSSELLARSGEIRPAVDKLGDLLWRSDLVKFANISIDSEEASRIGSSARGIVRSVEEFLVSAERKRQEEKAA